MGWFSGVVPILLVAAASAMFGYSAWRAAKNRKARLLHLGEMALAAALAVLSFPHEPTELSSDWPFWAASALLLLSVSLTIAHKRRRAVE